MTLRLRLYHDTDMMEVHEVGRCRFRLGQLLAVLSRVLCGPGQCLARAIENMTPSSRSNDAFDDGENFSLLNNLHRF